jgi:hypothetical protein
MNRTPFAIVYRYESLHSENAEVFKIRGPLRCDTVARDQPRARKADLFSEEELLDFRQQLAKRWTELFATPPLISGGGLCLTRHQRVALLSREVEALMLALEKSDPNYRYRLEKPMSKVFRRLPPSSLA